MIVDHIGLAVRDFNASRTFYRRALAPLRIQTVLEGDGWAMLGKDGKPELWLPSCSIRTGTTSRRSAISPRPEMRLLLSALAALLTLLFPLVASAQENPILLGAALRSRPAYDGSSSQRVDLVPVIRYYGRPWFARTTQGMLEGGARTELAPDFYAGVQLAYEAGRKSSESPFLESRNVPDLDVGVSAGAHLEWDRRFGPVPVTFLVRARQHLDSDRGGQADLRITGGVFSRGGFLAGVFWQATWGTENAVRSLYGAPSSALLFTSFGLLASYDVSRHWMLVGGLEFRQLRDEAAGSTLSERKSNYYATAGAAYRF